jgi:hypothetical protein
VDCISHPVVGYGCLEGSFIKTFSFDWHILSAVSTLSFGSVLWYGNCAPFFGRDF